MVREQHDVAKAKSRETEVLEEGDIFFLYRPKLGEDDPQGLGDIQRFY